MGALDENITFESFKKQVQLGAAISGMLCEEISEEWLFKSVICACIDVWADHVGVDPIELSANIADAIAEVRENE